MPKTALYAGSFDPITNGHADLIKRSLQFVDRLVVGVAVNVAKQPLFSEEERIELIRAALDNDPRVEVRAFRGLVVDFARELGVRVTLRGHTMSSGYWEPATTKRRPPGCLAGSNISRSNPGWRSGL